MPSVKGSAGVIGGFDVVVILTPHAGIDVQGLVNVARLVFDARGATHGLDAPIVIRL
jgi:UDP-N-acetyl-D-mannosaminuronate dehydrogenase